MFAGVSSKTSDPVAFQLLQKVRKQNKQQALPGTAPNSSPIAPFTQNAYVPPAYTVPLVASANTAGGDTLSVVSQVTTSAAGMIPKVTLSKEEKELRKQEWMAIRYPNMSQEDIDALDQRFMEMNKAYLTDEFGNCAFSKSMIESKMSAYVPYHATRIHDTILYVEQVGTLKNTNMPYYQWEPNNKVEAFGSRTDYAQGLTVEIATEKAGNLSNVYIIEKVIKGLKSNFPVAIGVRFGEFTASKEFRPYGNQKMYSNHSPDQSPTFHLIIPPFGSIPEMQVYRSTSDVNNTYGKNYTYLTEKEADITKGCHPGQKHQLVPVQSPIMEWIYESSNFAKMPEKSQDHEGYFMVPQAMYRQAVEALKVQTQAYIPVKDLTMFAIRFYPLQLGPFSADQLSRSVKERMQAYNEDLLPTTSQQTNHKQEVARLRETYGLHFHLDIKLMFRDFAESSVVVVEDEEEEEYNND
jgi:hypothetical protein